MTKDEEQKLVIVRHLESTANASKNFTLAQLAKISVNGGGGSFADFTGATSIAGGASGFVPAPAAGDDEKFLRGDGAWALPPDTSIVYSDATSLTSGLMSAADKVKLDGLEEYSLPTASASIKGGVIIGDGFAMTGDVLNVTISSDVFSGATSVTAGTSGDVPMPKAGDENKFLRGDGTWASIPSGDSRILLSVPTQNGSLTYSGTLQSPAWSNYDSAQLLIGGVYEATDAGTYTATFTPQDGFAWTDGTSNTKSVTWSIAKAALILSANISGAVAFGETGVITVSGNTGGGAISATSGNTNAVTIQSTAANSVTVECVGVSATDTTITISVPETSNYLAASTTCAVATEKATPTLTLSETSGSVGLNGTTTFTVTTPSDGALTVTSSDTSVATVSVSGNTVTVTGKSYGTATITVSQAAGTNHTAPADQTYTATCQMVVGSTLNDTDWATISAISQAGTGDTYWDVGDCKEITLNGKIGDCLTFENEKLCVYIVHFNYPMNGTAENNIIWGGFKTTLTDGVQVALCDSKYDCRCSTDGTICFNMSHTGQTTSDSGDGYYCTNYGGWKGTDFRYDILGATSTPPSEYNQLKSTSNVGYDATAATLTNPKADTLLAALPADFRNALRLWTRWIDAVGNNSKVEENIQATVDAVSLFAEYELFGRNSYGNNNESNHQTQMSYFSSGNKRKQFNHTDITTAVHTWLASPMCNYNDGFCAIDANGASGGSDSSAPWALYPAFKT